MKYFIMEYKVNLSYTINITAADGIVTQGVKTSTVILVT